MRVLGIESSCDETAVAVVDAEPDRPLLRILSNVIDSQIATHARFGGIVPEVASREHVMRIAGVVRQALAEAGDAPLDGVAVTSGPGLVGSLLVGMQVARGLALARGIPWVGVNHLEAHLSASLLAELPPAYPHVALIVSGGHTHLYLVRAFGTYELLGGTRDDAAGEAFDKVAKLLGLGFPGGPRIEAAAEGGDPTAVALPRGFPARRSFDFSFSGLKTAALYELQRRGGRLEGPALADFCASFQEAIADVLSKKAVAAAKAKGVGGVVLAGGVAANGRLRALVGERCAAARLSAFVPPRLLCTDNGAMVAAAGWMRLSAGEHSPWDLGPRSRWPLAGGETRGPRKKVRSGRLRNASHGRV